jgi:PKD repeat protein
VTAPQGIGIVSTTIDFGDGTSASLGGATSASQPHTYPASGNFPVTVTVTDTTGTTTVGSTIITVS